MQIAGAPRYPVPAPTSLPASSVAPDSPTERRLTPPPATSGQPAANPPSGRRRNEAAEAGAPTPQQQRLEQLQLADLVSRDQAVRAHEQAHAAVGGSYAGAPSYTYSRGPDGKRYAVGGEVGIDISVVPNDPAATLAKMETVLRAALAPADPSARDLRVAAQAQAQMAQARAELASASVVEQRRRVGSGAQQEPVQSARPAASADLELYRRLGQSSESSGSQVDLIA